MKKQIVKLQEKGIDVNDILNKETENSIKEKDEKEDDSQYNENFEENEMKNSVIEHSKENELFNIAESSPQILGDSKLKTNKSGKFTLDDKSVKSKKERTDSISLMQKINENRSVKMQDNSSQNAKSSQIIEGYGRRSHDPKKSEELKLVIVQQREREKNKKLDIKKKEEEKTLKILENLHKLEESKQMGLTKKTGFKKVLRSKSSQVLLTKKDESSILDNNYLNELREFINNDLPKEKQFMPDHRKKTYSSNHETQSKPSFHSKPKPDAHLLAISEKDEINKVHKTDTSGVNLVTSPKDMDRDNQGIKEFKKEHILRPENDHRPGNTDESNDSQVQVNNYIDPKGNYGFPKLKVEKENSIKQNNSFDKHNVANLKKEKDSFRDVFINEYNQSKGEEVNLKGKKKKGKKKKKQNDEDEERLNEIIRHNAAIKIQNFYRFITYYRNHGGFPGEDSNNSMSIRDFGDNYKDQDVDNMEGLVNWEEPLKKRPLSLSNRHSPRNMNDESFPKKIIIDEKEEIMNKKSHKLQKTPSKQIENSRSEEDNESGENSSSSYYMESSNRNDKEKFKNQTPNKKNKLEKSISKNQENDNSKHSIKEGKVSDMYETPTKEKRANLNFSNRNCYSLPRCDGSETSIIISPNSENSPRLHNLKELMMRQKMEKSMIDSQLEEEYNPYQQSGYTEERPLTNQSFHSLNSDKFEKQNKSSSSQGKQKKLNLLDIKKKKKNSGSDLNESNTSEKGQFDLSAKKKGNDPVFIEKQNSNQKKEETPKEDKKIKPTDTTAEVPLKIKSEGKLPENKQEIEKSHNSNIVQEKKASSEKKEEIEKTTKDIVVNNDSLKENKDINQVADKGNKAKDAEKIQNNQKQKEVPNQNQDKKQTMIESNQYDIEKNAKIQEEIVKNITPIQKERSKEEPIKDSVLSKKEEKDNKQINVQISQPERQKENKNVEVNNQVEPTKPQVKIDSDQGANHDNFSPKEQTVHPEKTSPGKKIVKKNSGQIIPEKNEIEVKESSSPQKNEADTFQFMSRRHEKSRTPSKETPGECEKTISQIDVSADKESCNNIEWQISLISETSVRKEVNPQFKPDNSNTGRKEKQEETIKKENPNNDNNQSYGAEEFIAESIHEIDSDPEILDDQKDSIKIDSLNRFDSAKSESINILKESERKNEESNKTKETNTQNKVDSQNLNNESNQVKEKKDLSQKADEITSKKSIINKFVDPEKAAEKNNIETKNEEKQKTIEPLFNNELKEKTKNNETNTKNLKNVIENSKTPSASLVDETATQTVIENLKTQEYKNTNESVKKVGEQKDNSRYIDIIDSERVKSINEKPEKVITNNNTEIEKPKPLTSKELALIQEVTESLLNQFINEELLQNNFSKKLIKNQLVKDKSLNLSHQNSNISENSLNSSMFMKSVIDEKKEVRNNIYINEIGPNVLSNIVLEEFGKNYNKILENLKKPIKMNPLLQLEKIANRDKDMKMTISSCLPELKSIVNPKSIKVKMDENNKTQRPQEKDLLKYDSIMNDCLLDCAFELLNLERHYGEHGEPMPWSNRTRVIKYKYTNSEMSKKNLKKNLETKIKELNNIKMGLFAENCEYESEMVNYEREKRLMNCITKNLNEEEESWKVLDVEETQVKIELSELVIEQLLNEVVEILEHVTLSRKHPELYQNKSIYGCEDIPRLPFQGNHYNLNDEMNR